MSARLHSQNGAEENYWRALELYDRGKLREALACAASSVDEGNEHASFLVGRIYETGGESVEIDLTKAVSHYRRAAVGLRNHVSYRYLARALMKLGPEHYGAAHRALEAAAESEWTPEVQLGFGWFYESAAEPDFERAKSHYLKAATQGRFRGFAGYASASRKAGQTFRAIGVDVARISFGWLIFMLVGRRARNEF